MERRIKSKSFAESGVAPGNFRRGWDDSSDEGTINAKNLRKNRFSSFKGGWHAPTGAIAPSPPLTSPLCRMPHRLLK